MKFQPYLQTVLNRAAPMEPAKQLIHAQLGMLTEVGELADAFKREMAYGKPLDAVNIVEEIGDVFWYFVLYCYEKRIDMRTLDDMVTADSGLPDGREPNEVVLRTLGLAVAMLAADDLTKIPRDGLLEGAEAVMLILMGLLLRFGSSVDACLDINDAKLEKRYPAKFSAAAALNRDLPGEREVLEQGHGQDQPG